MKWALSRAGELQSGDALSIDAQDLEASLNESWRIEKPGHVLASNVAGKEIGGIVESWVRRNWQLPVEFVRAQTSAYGITNGYSEPEKLGVDRWICLIALPTVCELPACVIDCGTAITLDLIDANCCHRGGIIIPGLQLMRDGLVARAQGIGPIGFDASNGLGRSTGSAIHAGTLLAAAGMVDKTLRRLNNEFGDHLSVIITGGDARQIAAESDFKPTIVPDLVLRGLAFVAMFKGAD